MNNKEELSQNKEFSENQQEIPKEEQTIEVHQDEELVQPSIENTVETNQEIFETNSEQLSSNTLNAIETKNQNSKKKSNKVLICVLVAIVFVAAIVSALLLLTNKDKTDSKEIKSSVKESDYRLSGNSLEPFDLYFLQLENEEVNKIYSPLSIKYALAMLNEGTDGESKEQIKAIIGDYKSKKYINSEHMSLANAMFIKDTFKNSIKEEYKTILLNKYNAEVILNSFKTPDAINNWTKDKTLGLIDNLVDDVSDLDFALINALAIDMEWVKVIQPIHVGDDWHASYLHENYATWVSSLEGSGYTTLKFDGNKDSKATEIGASINNYDIVKDIGEENIRKTVGKEYQKWLDEDPCNNASEWPDVNTYLDDYIKEINTGYGQYSSSTDFLVYTDDDVKVFAKDLKEYNGTTLQYVGIMPVKEKLNTYIKNMNASNLKNIISNLKPIKSDSFKEGVITKITGTIPLFKFEYELKLMEDLKKLGITDIFDKNKANISKISKQNLFVTKAIHKSNIEFSNEGIKAAAATIMGGAGAAGCSFEYNYDVPVEQIDLTFDKPYMFIIRDKETGEVWFTGTVYEPIEWSMDKQQEQWELN